MKIAQKLIDIWTPRERVLPSQWIEKHVVLPRSVSNHGYGNIRIPVPFKSIVDTLKTNPNCKTRVLRSSAQIGKSTLTICVLLYNAVYNQMHCLYLGHKAETSEQMCTMAKQIIKASPDLRRLYDGQKGANNKNTIRLRNGITIKFNTAGTAGSLRSFSAGCVVLDEVDAYRRAFKREGSPLDLAEARTISYGSTANVWLISTPTDEHGHISLEHDRGRSHSWWVTCPNCQTEHTLSIQQLLFPKDTSDRELEEDSSLIKWQCEHCKMGYTEKQFRALRDKGEFRENPDQDGKGSTILSYHLSGLMSNYMSFHYIISNFRASLRDRNKMNVFTNTVLGECFYGGKRKIESEDINKLTDSSITYGMAPDDTMMILAGIDSGRAGDEHDYHFYVTAVAMRPDSQFMVLSARRVVGEDELRHALKTIYMTPSGRQVKIRQAFLDTGHNAQTYGYGLAKRNLGMIPVKGDARCLELFNWSHPPMHPHMPLMIINKQSSLRNVFLKMELEELRFAADLPPVFHKHMQSWQYDIESRKYVEVIMEQDHFLDSLRYVMVGFHDDQYDELHAIMTFDEFKDKFGKVEQPKEQPPSQAQQVVPRNPYSGVQNWKSKVTPY